MRHALGLRGDTPPRSSASGSQPQRHRFVRDGEVPVTVLRRDHQPDGEHGANQLDAARQAIRSEATAKERAERLLAEAQARIRDLQTKLGHERLARDEAVEAVRRLETEARVAAHAQETAEAELVAERLARRNAEDALAEALEAHQEAEAQLRDAISVQEVRQPPRQQDRRRPWRTGRDRSRLVGVDGRPKSATRNPRLSNGGCRAGGRRSGRSVAQSPAGIRSRASRRRHSRHVT
jgi:hypothetical protein